MFHVKHFQKRKDDYMSYQNFPYSNFHELNADWILEQVRDCVKKVADLGLSFEQLKEYVNNYFSTLDVDTAIAEEIKRLIDNGTMGTLINQTLLGEINSKVDRLTPLVEKTYVNKSNVLTVGKTEGVMFSSINEAIVFVKSKNISLINPYTIIVFPATYREQLVLNDIHGLCIMGLNRDHTKLIYSGAYPDCVIHVQGDVTFRNLTIQNENLSTYAIHSDPVDTLVTGLVQIDNCYIIGYKCIGYGSGKLTSLRVENSLLSSLGDACIYAHNSAYANRIGQSLVVLNNMFTGSATTYALILDDAGYSNGGVSSEMIVLISGNTHLYAGYMRIQFRKATGVQSTWKSYLPNDDANIRCGTGCANNSGIPGLNVIENHFVQSMVGTAPADSAGKIYITATFPPHLNGNNYNIAVTACNVDGVGRNATFLNKGESFYQFTIDGVSVGGAHNWQVNVEFTVA